MARKKEERGNGSRNKNKKGQNKREKPRSGSGSEDLDIIKSQLLALGLSLRQVPGDGYLNRNEKHIILSVHFSFVLSQKLLISGIRRSA